MPVQGESYAPQYQAVADAWTRVAPAIEKLRLSLVALRGTAASVANPDGTFIEQGWNDLRDSYAKAIGIALLASMEIGWRYAANDLKRSNIKVDEAKASDVAYKRAVASAASIILTKQKRIAAKQLQDHQEGDGYMGLVQTYLDDQSQETTISNTEIVAGIMLGTILFGQAAAAQLPSGQMIFKTWRTMQDSSVCSRCLALEGETVPLDAYFSGGEFAPPDAHVGDRCFAELSVGPVPA